MSEQILAVIIGGILAIAGGAGSQAFTHWLSVRHKRTSMKQAFAGEIGALIDIIERRGYLSELDRLIAGIPAEDASIFMSVKITHNYFDVYDNHCQHLGALQNELPRRVTRFYVYAKALVEDFAVPEHGQIQREFSIEELETSRQLLSELIEQGYGLVKDLEK